MVLLKSCQVCVGQVFVTIRGLSLAKSLEQDRHCKFNYENESSCVLRKYKSKTKIARPTLGITNSHRILVASWSVLTIFGSQHVVHFKLVCDDCYFSFLWINNCLFVLFQHWGAREESLSEYLKPISKFFHRDGKKPIFGGTLCSAVHVFWYDDDDGKHVLHFNW